MTTVIADLGNKVSVENCDEIFIIRAGENFRIYLGKNEMMKIVDQGQLALTALENKEREKNEENI
jgi:hypothetical protein